jgi:hypothetical protein
MIVSELIEKLQELQKTHGDLYVEMQYTVSDTVCRECNPYGYSSYEEEEDDINTVTFVKSKVKYRKDTIRLGA